MVPFVYYAPTKIVFGKKAEEKVGELVREQGCKKILLHYGGKSAEKSGLLNRICDSLKAEKIDFVTLGGVVPNPRLSKVHEGIRLCRAEQVDFILAVGGGSVIDSAKAIGYGVPYAGEVWDFYSKKAQPKTSLPVGAVLTISAAGSEMSDSSVITNEDGWLKRGCNSNLCRCRFAVLNPELTYTLPAYQTACGCVDILMHTMERYFTHEHHTELTDELAEGLMRTVIHNAKILNSEPENYDARAEIMWASSLSHNGLTGCGTIGDWACHQLEHELGGMFDVAHGAGLAALWPHWARYVYLEESPRFARFAVKVLGVKQAATPEDTALAGIAAMENFYHSIDMPINLHELGIHLTEEQLQELAHKCSFSGTRTIGAFRKLTKEDMKNIYNLAR